MPDNRAITGHTALTGATLAAGDLHEVVDVSDTTDAATGTNKSLTTTEKIVGLITLGRLFAVDSALSTTPQAVEAGGVASALLLATDEVEVTGLLTAESLDAGGGTLEVSDTYVTMATLPTTDPTIAGALWVDVAGGRVVKQSAG
jgi:hypothetical protein